METNREEKENSWRRKFKNREGRDKLVLLICNKQTHRCSSVFENVKDERND